mmetsp:Transcript_3192/g.6610  ORF Transcript_3192/g.6610 Transcript_3192/m.6610 type:complete len:207 (-) Transcript_3192:128-748(-)
MVQPTWHCANGVDDDGTDPPDSYNRYDAEQNHANDSYAADGIDPPQSYDGYEVKLHATDSCDVTTPRLPYSGDGADNLKTDLNVSDITNPTIFEDENLSVGTSSFSYDDNGADRNQTDLYFGETQTRASSRTKTEFITLATSTSFSKKRGPIWDTRRTAIFIPFWNSSKKICGGRSLASFLTKLHCCFPIRIGLAFLSMSQSSCLF